MRLLVRRATVHSRGCTVSIRGRRLSHDEGNDAPRCPTIDLSPDRASRLQRLHEGEEPTLVDYAACPLTLPDVGR